MVLIGSFISVGCVLKAAEKALCFLNRLLRIRNMNANKKGPLSSTEGLLWALRLATVMVFIGRAWQQLYWDIPIRTVLWDERLMSPLVTQWLGMSWRDWVTSASIDQAITTGVRLGGLFYVLAAVAAWYAQPGRKWTNAVVALGGVGLVVLAFLYTKEKFYHLGQFFEYSLQFGAPFLLLSALHRPRLSAIQWLSLRLAIALTFTCHGLYAISYYPRPGNFTEMVMAGLWLDEQSAVTLLQWAGIGDFLAAAALLLPWRNIQLAALLYTMVWGFLTTMARVWSYLWIADLATVFWQWVPECLYRWPHFLGPAGAWWYLYLHWQHEIPQENTTSTQTAI